LQAGKSPKVVIVACMRKLLTSMNAMLKNTPRSARKSLDGDTRLLSRKRAKGRQLLDTGVVARAPGKTRAIML
jgi:hypothetical protein